MAITAKPVPSSVSRVDEAIKLFKEAIQDLVDQLNERGQVYVSSIGRVPTGTNKDDLIVVSTKGKISILVRRSKGYDSLTADMIGGLSKNSTLYLGVTTSGAAPTTANYPNNGNWGFHNRTGGSPNLYFTFNLGGVIKTQILS